MPRLPPGAWVVLFAVALNIATAIGNGFLGHANYKMLATNAETAAAYRRLFAALPEHPCGAVIQPGERCIATFVLTPQRESSW